MSPSVVRMPLSARSYNARHNAPQITYQDNVVVSLVPCNVDHRTRPIPPPPPSDRVVSFAPRPAKLQGAFIPDSLATPINDGKSRKKYTPTIRKPGEKMDTPKGPAYRLFDTPSPGRNATQKSSSDRLNLPFPILKHGLEILFGENSEESKSIINPTVLGRSPPKPAAQLYASPSKMEQDLSIHQPRHSASNVASQLFGQPYSSFLQHFIDSSVAATASASPASASPAASSSSSSTPLSASSIFASTFHPSNNSMHVSSSSSSSASSASSASSRAIQTPLASPSSSSYGMSTNMFYELDDDIESIIGSSNMAIQPPPPPPVHHRSISSPGPCNRVKSLSFDYTIQSPAKALHGPVRDVSGFPLPQDIFVPDYQSDYPPYCMVADQYRNPYLLRYEAPNATASNWFHPVSTQPSTPQKTAIPPPPPPHRSGFFAHKKEELNESPVSKTKFKEMSKLLKERERDGYEDVKDWLFECLQELPSKAHWRVLLELADIAKRDNHINEARELFREINKLQPYASLGWLEHAKMEEECGHLKSCRRLLLTGLHYCPHNESLLIKAIKLEERMGNVDEARGLLGSLKDLPLERSWRILMEGALLEARIGNIEVARKVFKYLIKNTPWYGPIYLEACKFEERWGTLRRAFDICQEGLQNNPRYGPLWFAAMKICEKAKHDKAASFDSPSLDMDDLVDRAVKSISKELIWKVYFEFAQIADRENDLSKSRKLFAQSALHCPANLQWKVWLGGARTELKANQLDVARELLNRANQEVPVKQKFLVLIEIARMEELGSNLNQAREVLQKARKETKHEWKVFLESVLMEMRSGHISSATALAADSLQVHTGTGRLWAALIQLQQADRLVTDGGRGLESFMEAIQEVPKSGEVWCEGARIRLNPLSPKFNPLTARRFLEFAIQFTPQYGDSFVEYLRLEMMMGASDADIKRIEQLCINADPNYGTVWFHCKQHPLETAREVFQRAHELLKAELSVLRTVYEKAIQIYNGNHNSVQTLSQAKQVHKVFKQVAAELDIDDEVDTISPNYFWTGLLCVNKTLFKSRELHIQDLWRLIFGSDQIVP